MNSKFFSIDSIIGARQNHGEEKQPALKDVKHDAVKLNEEKTVALKNEESSDIDNRRLKIPSFHASIRDAGHTMHESPSTRHLNHVVHETANTAVCRSKPCSSPHGPPHGPPTNIRYQEHRNSSGETCPNSCKIPPKQKRLSLTKNQLGELEKCFLKNYYPTEATRDELAMRLGLSHARVKVWFQNRRAKWQRNQKIKTEWQSFLHNPFAAAIGLSHHRLMLQQQHQLLADTQSKEYDPQCLQTPMPSLYSTFPHSSMTFMLPRQDLMSYSIGKPPMQTIDDYVLAKQAAQHENNTKMSLTDESDSEETSNRAQNKNTANVTNTKASNITEKPTGLRSGQFWW
ncbi:ALX homeobox protein 1-like [Mercenaria mercenaria]|uniref:ALX homeobox protein 1-like n=1 Tax=Mercenaria mercenaria TaxID=6596 RepID=UPI00234E3911|nr:ALX homeobox protein 1-like [Mercenaria mercenaria]